MMSHFSIIFLKTWAICILYPGEDQGWWHLQKCVLFCWWFSWDGSPGGADSEWPFLNSWLHTLSLYLLPWVFCPLLRRSKVSTLWSSFFLNFMLSMNCILGILGFVANIHVSVNAYHVSSFVIGLPHSEYFLVLSSCPKISWSRSLYLRSTLNKTPKAYALTSRVDKWHLIKLQSFCKAKDTVNQTKQQPSDWEKIFTHLHPIEG